MKYDELSGIAKKLIPYLHSLDPADWHIVACKHNKIFFEREDDVIIFHLNQEKKIDIISCHLMEIKYAGHFDETFFEEAKVFMENLWNRFYKHYYHQLRLRLLFIE